MADAKVTLISDQNQTMASGRTDGSGIWRTSDAKALGKGTPYMVTIEKGEDFTFLLLNTMTVDTTGLDVGGAAPPGEGYQAFLYGQRDLYRPGEKLQGLAIVRDGALHVPPSMPALLRHRDPQGRELETRRLTTGDKGLAPFESGSPGLLADRPAHAGAGGGPEGDRPVPVPGRGVRAGPDLGEDRATEGEDRARGRRSAYQVQSGYLFGAPAAGLPVETRVRLVDSTFAPKGFEGFSFRNDDRKLDDKEVLSSTDGKLDDEGRERVQGRDARRRARALLAGGGDHGAGAGAGGARGGGDAAAAGAPLSLLHRACGGPAASGGQERVRRPGQAGRVRIRGRLAGGQGGRLRGAAGRLLRGPLEHGAAQDAGRRLAL